MNSPQTLAVGMVERKISNNQDNSLINQVEIPQTKILKQIKESYNDQQNQKFIKSELNSHRSQNIKQQAIKENGVTGRLTPSLVREINSNQKIQDKILFNKAIKQQNNKEINKSIDNLLQEEEKTQKVQIYSSSTKLNGQADKFIDESKSGIHPHPTMPDKLVTAKGQIINRPKSRQQSKKQKQGSQIITDNDQPQIYGSSLSKFSEFRKLQSKNTRSNQALEVLKSNVPLKIQEGNTQATISESKEAITFQQQDESDYEGEAEGDSSNETSKRGEVSAAKTLKKNQSSPGQKVKSPKLVNEEETMYTNKQGDYMTREQSADNLGQHKQKDIEYTSLETKKKSAQTLQKNLNPVNLMKQMKEDYSMVSVSNQFKIQTKKLHSSVSPGLKSRQQTFKDSPQSTLDTNQFQIRKSKDNKMLLIENFANRKYNRPRIDGYNQNQDHQLPLETVHEVIANFNVEDEENDLYDQVQIPIKQSVMSKPVLYMKKYAVTSNNFYQVQQDSDHKNISNQRAHRDQSGSINSRKIFAAGSNIYHPDDGQQSNEQKMNIQKQPLQQSIYANLQKKSQVNYNNGDYPNQGNAVRLMPGFGQPALTIKNSNIYNFQNKQAGIDGGNTLATKYRQTMQQPSNPVVNQLKGGPQRNINRQSITFEGASENIVGDEQQSSLEIGVTQNPIEEGIITKHLVQSRSNLRNSSYQNKRSLVGQNEKDQDKKNNQLSSNYLMLQQQQIKVPDNNQLASNQFYSNIYQVNQKEQQMTSSKGFLQQRVNKPDYKEVEDNNFIKGVFADQQIKTNKFIQNGIRPVSGAYIDRNQGIGISTGIHFNAHQFQQMGTIQNYQQRQAPNINIRNIQQPLGKSSANLFVNDYQLLQKQQDNNRDQNQHSQSMGRRQRKLYEGVQEVAQTGNFIMKPGDVNEAGFIRPRAISRQADAHIRIEVHQDHRIIHHLQGEKQENMNLMFYNFNDFNNKQKEPARPTQNGRRATANNTRAPGTQQVARRQMQPPLTQGGLLSYKDSGGF